MIVNLLNDKVAWKVLFFMSYIPGRGYKYSDLKKGLNMNNSSLYKVIHKLEFYKVLKKENNVVKVDFNNKLTLEIFDIIELEKRRFNNINYKVIFAILDFLSYIDKEIGDVKQVFLFGSYAKRTQSVNSDVDIAVILKNKRDLFEFAYKVEESYGIKIELHEFEEEEFKIGKLKLIDDIKRDGIKLLYE